MAKVKRSQAEGTKGPKNKRKRNEKTCEVGSSSAHAEILSEEVPQMMAPVTLHGDAAPGSPGGMDAAPIPDKNQTIPGVMERWNDTQLPKVRVVPLQKFTIEGLRRCYHISIMAPGLFCVNDESK